MAEKATEPQSRNTSSTEDGDDLAAMQAAMGFSSFGDPQHKKRKYHHDGYTDNLEPAGSSGSGSGSGSNAAPLGVSPRIGIESSISAPSPAGPATEAAGSARGTIQGDRTRESAHGAVAGKNWWDGYYDLGSNGYPWHDLEKELGLEEVGTWM